MRVQKRLRHARFSARGAARVAAAVVALAAAGTIAALGCALGPEQEPGCHDHAECGEGFTCHAGACFRTTTDASTPSPPSSADAAADG